MDKSKNEYNYSQIPESFNQFLTYYLYLYKFNLKHLIVSQS